MTQQPIPPNTPLAVILEAQEWNAIMAMLGKQPYEVVAALLGKIGEQLQTGAAQVAQPAGNGIDRVGQPLVT